MEPADDPIPELASAPSPAPQRATLHPQALVPRLVGLTALLGAVLWLFAAPAAERLLSPAEIMARQATFAEAGALLLAPVQPQERAEALKAMRLPLDQQQVLERQQSELVWFTLWDDRDQDGDIVAVESDGFRQQVQIAHAPVRLAVPRPRGGTVVLRGVHDGGGGITVAVQSGGGQIGLPPLMVGQAVTIPVR